MDTFSENYESFNSNVNSGLDRIFSNKKAAAVINIALLLYGSLAAPKMPPKVAVIVGNTFFRVGFMALVLYISTRNPAISVMLSLSYFITTSYFGRNALETVQKTGVLTPELKQIIKDSTSVDPTTDIFKEKQTVPEDPIVRKPITSEFQTGVPQALLPSGDAAIPSGTPATESTMMATSQENGDVPVAASPAKLSNLACAKHL